MSKSKAKQATLFQSWGGQATNKQNDHNRGRGSGSSGLFQTFGSNNRPAPFQNKPSTSSSETKPGVNQGNNDFGGGGIIDLCEDEDDDALLSMALDEGMQHLSNIPGPSSGIIPTSTPTRGSSGLFQVFGQGSRSLQKTGPDSSSWLIQGKTSGASSHPSVDMPDAGNLSLGAEDIDATLSQCQNLEDLTGFDLHAGRLWIYPTNYPVREYQFNIVQQALFKNTMVTLPTGLGKTFIAAVVMYNFFRWYPEGKVVFMAPTKPLVAQQIEACYNIMGIPKKDTAVMTGTMPPSERQQAWQNKRVFFLTPQVLTNDLSRGTCQAGSIKCLVVDEAHKALGNHAYCQVVREIVKYSREFRLLALSATPGSDIQSVQRVLSNLLISHIELRMEESIDIKPYTHERVVEKIVIPLGSELTAIRAKYLQVLEVVVGRLKRAQVIYNREVTSLSKFVILKAREAFRQNPPPSLPTSQFGTVEGDFALAMSLYHGFELLQLHGLRSLYNFLQPIINGEKGYGRTKTELLRNENFNEIMAELQEKYCTGPEGSSQNPSQIKNFAASHPKMEKLENILLEHFKKFEKVSSTRVMIFSQYRDSVKEITDMLRKHHPLIKSMSFIGHSQGRSAKGFSQKEQLKVMREFREGGYNTLVSTCVGEEGLDIGDVDLIICFDAHKSPVRLVQRMGRTGRKREGRIIMLVTEGKEEHVYNQSQYSKRSIHRAILNGARSLQFYPHNPRMVPDNVKPTCHKMHITVAADPPPKSARQPAGKRKSMKQRRLTDMVPASTSSVPGPGVPDDGVLSRSEYLELRDNYSVDDSTVRSLPKHHEFCSLSSTQQACMEAPVVGEVRGVKELSLTEWLPWQNRLQDTKLVSHSTRSQHLVDLVEFIELQRAIGEGEDNYGMEMSMFLNEADVLKPGQRDIPGTGILKFCTMNAPNPLAASPPSPPCTRSRDPGPVAKAKSSKVKKRRRTNVIASDSSDDDFPDLNLGGEDMTVHEKGASPRHSSPQNVSGKRSHSNKGPPKSRGGKRRKKEKSSSHGQESPALVKALQIEEDDEEDFEGLDTNKDYNLCDDMHQECEADFHNLDGVEGVSGFQGGTCVSDNKQSQKRKFKAPGLSSHYNGSGETLPKAAGEGLNSEDDLPLFQQNPGLDSTVVTTSPGHCPVPPAPPLEEIPELCSAVPVGELSPDLGTLMKEWDKEWKKRTSQTLKGGIAASGPKSEKCDVMGDELTDLNLQSLFDDEDFGGCGGTPHRAVSGSPIFEASKSGDRASHAESNVSRQTEMPVKDEDQSAGGSRNSRVETDDNKMNKSDTPMLVLSDSGHIPSKITATVSPEIGVSATKAGFFSSESPIIFEKDVGALPASVDPLSLNNIKEESSAVPVMPSLPNFNLDADSFFDCDDAYDMELLSAIETPVGPQSTPGSGASLSRSSRENVKKELQSARGPAERSGRGHELEDQDVVSANCDTPRLRRPVSNRRSLSPDLSKLDAVNSSALTEKNPSPVDEGPNRTSYLNKCGSPVFHDEKVDQNSNPCGAKETAEEVKDGDSNKGESEIDLCILPQFDLGFDLDEDIVPPSPCAMSSMSQRSRSSMSRRHTRLSFPERGKEGAGQTEETASWPSTQSKSSSTDLLFSLRQGGGREIFTKFATTITDPIIEEEEEGENENGEVSAQLFQAGGQSNSPPMDIATSMKPSQKAPMTPASAHNKYSQPDQVAGSGLDITSSQGFGHQEPCLNVRPKLSQASFDPELSPMKSPIFQSTQLGAPSGSGVFSSTPKRSLTPPGGGASPDMDDELADVIAKEGSKSESDESLVVMRKRKAAVLESSDDSFSPTEKPAEIPFKTPIKPVKKTKVPRALSDDDDFDTGNVVPRIKRNSSILPHLDDEDDFADDPVQIIKVQPKEKPVKKRKRRSACGFLDVEAELSDEEDVQVSSDEFDASDEEDLEGFIDNATQALNTETHAMYMQSVASPVRRPGQFRLQYDQRRFMNVYSQLPADEPSQYEQDSFCIDEPTDSEEEFSVEEEITPDKQLLVAGKQGRRGGRPCKPDTKEVRGKRRLLRMADSSSDEEVVIVSPTQTQALSPAPVPRKRKAVIGSSDDEEPVTEVNEFTRIKSSSVKEGAPGASTSDKSSSSDAMGTSVSGVIHSEKLGSFTTPSRYHQADSTSAHRNVVSPVLSRGVDDHSLSIGTQDPPKGGIPLKCLSREERLRIQKQKQEEFRRKMAAKNQGTAASVSGTVDHGRTANETAQGKVQTFSTAVVTPRPRGQPVVLVDSKEVSGAQEIISALRLTHSLTVTARQLVAADYVVSNRMAVDRRLWSDFSNGTNRNKMVERIQRMRGLYERSCLIIETDKVKPGETKPAKFTQYTKYVNTMLAYLTQVDVKLFFTESQGETSAVLAELCQQEVKKGMQISMPAVFSPAQEQVFKFYASIPHVNTINAVNLTVNFRTIKEFMSSSADTIAERAVLPMKKAQGIRDFICHEFDLQMTPLKKLNVSW